MIENATGGSGDDAIVGNAADNVMTGGAGADTFIFVEGQAGYDVITDYERGVDRLDVSDYGALNVLRNLEVDQTLDGLELSFFDQTILLEGFGLAQTSAMDYA
ncbi:serralysin [Roseivivax lentus]|uniref:Serralysin n=1 Tax=Roseivivax lentus TaxID=633194 RepID=A0A1N7PIW0_9RHOB|nr:serralysin [Roseivivax lentus]